MALPIDALIAQVVEEGTSGLVIRVFEHDEVNVVRVGWEKRTNKIETRGFNSSLLSYPRFFIFLNELIIRASGDASPCMGKACPHNLSVETWVINNM